MSHNPFDAGDATNSKPLHYISIKTKWLPVPLFHITNAETGSTLTADHVAGNITGIKYKESEYEGSKIQNFSITLDSPAGVGLLTIGFTSLGRAILNSLLSLKTSENVKLSVYKNKKGYDAVYVTQNGQKLAWALDMKDPRLQPEVVKNADGTDFLMDGKRVLKWDAVKEFLKNSVESHFTGFTFVVPSNGYVAPAHDEPATEEDIASIFPDAIPAEFKPEF